MKHFIYIALIGALLSGCADTPLKQADIEDRALSTASAKLDTNDTLPRKSVDTAAVSTSGMSDAGIEAKTLVTDKVVKAPVVETRGVALQDPQAMPLDVSSRDASGDKAAAVGEGSKKDDADALRYEAQPILDPSNPQSPLAQRRIHFDFDSAAIQDEYRELLEMHAKYLKTETAARLILQGHADERGSREYNLALGQRRSESVYRAMNLLGVPEHQMEAVSLGEEKPLVEGHDESAWAQNRRTELLYQGE